jgi:hypothetical protein
VALSSPRTAFIIVGAGTLLGTLALLQVRIAGPRPSEPGPEPAPGTPEGIGLTGVEARPQEQIPH